MTRIKTSLWLLTGASAVVLCAACAPVGPPPPGAVGPANVVPKGPDPKQPLLSKGADLAFLRPRVEQAIKNVRERDLLTTHGFWTIFHGILGQGFDTTLLDPLTNQRVNALDYVCKGGPIRGLIFIPTAYGLDVETAKGQDLMFVGQGHQDQFIAELAQWGIPADKKFVVLGKDYTYMDFVRNAQMRARLDGSQELSWTILVIGQYISTEAAWTNSAGQKMTLEEMLRFELAQPMDKAACGGTHRLFDLAWVQFLHQKRGGKLEGVWKEIADNTVKYQQLTRKYQNADGSFSTDFFKGRDARQETQLRISTTGHIFEWLALTLPDRELEAPWVQEAANALALMILGIEREPMEGGTLYHAVHGLSLYHARLFDRAKLAQWTFLPL